MLDIRIAANGKIIKLHVKEGDIVKYGSPIVNMELSSTKTNVPYVSNFKGTILSVNKKVGDDLTTEEILCTVDGKMITQSKCIAVTVHD